MKRLLLLLTLCWGSQAVAQQYRPVSASAIYQELQHLQKLGTVMYIAAHPDDENTRLIAYMVHHDHMQTVYLSLTRGDGGQNILGNEQGAALGLIRTHEMMQARHLDGAGQLFTPFVDFGFTKSPEETFSFWNQEDVVASVKEAIQQYRPDVLICRFPTTGEGGHGQHTASAIAAKLAFESLQSSKDPKVWKPKRLLFNAFRFGSRNTIREGQFKLPINQYDPLLGEAYGELAGRSRSEHKSQGAGTPQTYGLADEYFELMAGAPMQQSLYDGVDTSWSRVGTPAIGRQIGTVMQEFDFTQPQKSVPALIALREQIGRLKPSDPFWVDKKLKELDQIILHCAGIQAEALTGQSTATPGDTLELMFKIAARMSDVSLLSVTDPYGLPLMQQAVPLANDVVRQLTLHCPLPQEMPLTQPFWMQQAPQQHHYVYPEPYRNEALNKPECVLRVTLRIAGTTSTISVPVSYKYLNPTRGDVTEPLRILPAADIEPLQPMLVADPGQALHTSLRLTLRQSLEQPVLQVWQGKRLLTANQWDYLPGDTAFTTSLRIPEGAVKPAEGPLHYVLQSGAKRYDKTLKLIQYDHIPTLQYFEPAQSLLMDRSWASPGIHRIGYIAGAGDKVADMLSLCGFELSILSDADLSNLATLQQYDAIICGVRMANVRKDLARYMPVLWQYVAEGGRVLMQYNTSMGLQIPDFTPLPMTLSRDRVTDEHAAVTLLHPEDPVLHYPNEIRPADFDGWVQERGIYFPSAWDGHYKTVLSMHDAGEEPLQSAILYAPYGKGWFVYSGLAFFRQLPAGNVGAMRLFVNLLHVGMKP